MHTAIVNCVYPPEPVVSAQIGRDLAEHLAAKGIKVTVLCPFPSRPYGVAHAANTGADGHHARTGCGAAIEMMGRDFSVVRLQSFTAPQSRVLPRMRESASFGRHVCRYLWAMRDKPDVVYMNAWPLFAQANIANFCFRRGIPLVMQVMDVYPESLVRKLPAILRGVVEKPLLWLDRRTARRVNHVTVISNSMLRHYAQSRNLQPDKISLIHTWCDEARFAEMPERNVCFDCYEMRSDKFTFLFLGNIGPVAGVESIMEAFHSANLAGAQLVIAGEGSAKADCIRYKERLGSTGIDFVSDPDVNNTPYLLGMADVCLLPMQKGSASSSIPSKLMAYMLSGRPIIATVDSDSDTAQCIREAHAGWVGEPENTQWLAAKMREVAAMDKGKLDAMGRNGRAFAMEHFAKAKGVLQLGAVIERQARIGS